MARFSLDLLNPQQKEAVQTIEGPLLVLAGAGTGKTKVITTRIAHMIEGGINPAHIAGMTFTNKAAREMRDRLALMVSPEAAKRVTLGTFHAFCARILRRDIQYAGNYNSSYSIADTSDQTSLIRQAAAEIGYAKEDVPTQEAAAFISNCKNKLLDPEAALAAAADMPGDLPLAEIYQRYQQILELQNSVDFDDMLLLTLKIFHDHPERLAWYQEQYQYLLVDEYQDTNAAQFKLLEYLTQKRKNICVVGDDDQSIYGWRGAEIENILDFPKLYPGTKEIKLEQNYRSTNKILAAANAVISKNGTRYDKNLWSAKGDGENIQILGMRDGESEAEFVADAVENMISRNPDYSYSDFAILYRSNHLSRTFEQAFRRRGIRPKIIGGQEFFQRKEVKDAAAYLKLIVNFRDDQSLLRIIPVPPRGIGDKAVLKLRDLEKASSMPLLKILTHDHYLKSISAPAAKSSRFLGDTIAEYRELFSETGNLAEKVEQYLREVGYLDGFQRMYKDIKEAESRRDNVMEFINYVSMFEVRFNSEHDTPCTLRDFMENYSLMDDNDRTDDDGDQDGPIFSTVHAAKGLEFPCVFIVGMEQGLFPHERALLESNRGDEEERRLFYVAITRAKENLYLTYAHERFKYGVYERHAPSRYLRDIPADLADNPNPDEFFPEASVEDRIAAFESIMKALKN